MEHEAFRIFLALLCVGLLVAYPHDNQEQPNERRVQYCGTKLSNAISELCKGHYNSFITYRPKPFITRREAKVLLRRKRRGITDECCRKACSPEELRSFCGDR